MKIGDLVYNKHYGIGKIIYIENNIFNYYAVEFENYNSELNDLGGRCKNGYGYWCRNMDITPYKFTKKDLKDGDKLTTRGGAELIYLTNNYNRSFIAINNTPTERLYSPTQLKEDLTMINREYSIDDIVKVERPTYNTILVKERKLDKRETEYLAGVIRPFKDKVKCIYKMPNGDDEFIEILFNDAGSLPFPPFKKGTMYKGLELKKRYTLKELELDE